MAYIALSPRGWRPRASVQYIPYIPRARVITITYYPMDTEDYHESVPVTARVPARHE